MYVSHIDSMRWNLIFWDKTKIASAARHCNVNQIVSSCLITSWLQITEICLSIPHLDFEIIADLWSKVMKICSQRYPFLEVMDSWHWVIPVLVSNRLVEQEASEWVSIPLSVSSKRCEYDSARGFLKKRKIIYSNRHLEETRTSL